MNHPYSSAESYIYAIEPDAPPQHPYPDLTPAFPPRYDPSWVTESTFKPQTPPDEKIVPPRQHGHSQLRPLPPLPPLRPLRRPTAPPPQERTAPAEPVSGWIDDDEDDSETEDSEARTSNETMITRSSNAPHPKSKSTVIRIEGEDDPPVPRPVPVPYEKRPSERAVELRKHEAWRKKIIDIMCL